MKEKEKNYNKKYKIKKLIVTNIQIMIKEINFIFDFIFIFI